MQTTQAGGNTNPLVSNGELQHRSATLFVPEVCVNVATRWVEAVLNHVSEEFDNHISEREPCVLSLRLGHEGFREFICQGFDLLKARNPLTEKPVGIDYAAGWKKPHELFSRSRVFPALQLIN